MPYQRNLENVDFTNFADQNLKKCPYCSSNNPYWHEEGYNANWAMGYQFEMGYKFRCSQCGGEIEFRCHTRSSFFDLKFRSVIMLNAGTGTNNRHLVGYVITYQDLLKICSISVKADGYCVNCGGPMASGTIFCTSCGHEHKEMIPFKDDEKPCIHCGKGIKKHETFCIYCGGRQPDKYIEPEKPAVYCIKCGYKIKEDTVFCPNCRAVQNEEKAKQYANTKFCTNCGELVKEGTVFCTNCGAVQRQR